MSTARSDTPAFLRLQTGMVYSLFDLQLPQLSLRNRGHTSSPAWLFKYIVTLFGKFHKVYLFLHSTFLSQQQQHDLQQLDAAEAAKDNTKTIKKATDNNLIPFISSSFSYRLSRNYNRCHKPVKHFLLIHTYMVEYAS